MCSEKNIYAKAVLKLAKLNTAAQQREAVVQGRSLPPIPASVYVGNLLRYNLCILFFVQLIFVLCLVSGCRSFGYNFGTKNPYGSDVQTVHVPIFKSTVLRQDLAVRLTEAVCKRIESRTAYKVVSNPMADSVLEGKIVLRSRGVALVNSYNDPRQIVESLSVEVRWQDRRKRDLLEFDPIAWNVGSAQLSVQEYLVPEFGQSELTAEQAEIDKIANQIVNMMELPW